MMNNKVMSLQKLCLLHISYEQFLERQYAKNRYLLFRYVYIDEDGLYDDIQRVMRLNYPECVYVIFEINDLVVIYSQCTLVKILNTGYCIVQDDRVFGDRDFVDVLDVCCLCTRFQYVKANYMSCAMIDDLMIKHIIYFKKKNSFIHDKFICICKRFMENKFNLVIT